MTTSAPSRSCSSDTRRPIVKSMIFKEDVRRNCRPRDDDDDAQQLDAEKVEVAALFEHTHRMTLHCGEFKGILELVRLSIINIHV